ncbi:MAG: DUF1294 domain-containing protein [Lachnospiraceae bacterium]|nr:DUF1294 domain-containing protein [Lachnospiraceae bacterium]
MKTILIIYVIMSNVIGFLMMGIDKLKAKRRRYRIPERTLFTTAILGGSIGILIGMYVFRHKTRHLSFVLGIPVILVLQLLFINFLFSWNQKRMGSPSQAVQYELDLIRNLDDDTIQSFVSYENLMNSQIDSGEFGPETTEAVQLFFKNFKYNIHNETIENDTATVSVNITNIDAEALARDLCISILKDSVRIYPESDTTPTTSDYYQLLLDTLKSHNYEKTVTTAYFHLQKEDGVWVILADDELEDQLVSGFISSINNPWLLSPDTVLSIHLDAFKSLDAEKWMDFLEIEDVFATYNTDYSTQIDLAYMTRIADAFDYEILRCQENGNTAVADVRITSADLGHILSSYKKSLLEYAASPVSIRDDEVTVSNKMSQMLLKALENDASTASTDIKLTLQNNGKSWNVTFGTEFTNALMGDIAGAIDTFNESDDAK